MKKFVFKLARLQRLREIKKREERVRLARAIALADAARREEELERGALDEARRTALPPDLASSPAAWRQLEAWRARRRERLLQAQRQAEAAAARRSEAWRDWERARRASRVLERLHERRLARWRLENEREEQKFQDEMHLLRRDRRRYEERGS